MKKGTGGFLEPEKILSQLNLRDDMEVADFGCGHGYFSIPLAKIVAQGRIYALDVRKDALQVVSSQAELEKITNIKTIHCNLEVPNGSKLKDESMDLVLLANILFQSEQKAEILREAKRAVKRNGRIIIIDWIVGSTIAPKEGWLISKTDAKELAEAEELIFEKDLDMDDQHYGMEFKK
jgi:ubiquinone/menaquinone biosynthesis C-methylase UbiE